MANVIALAKKYTRLVDEKYQKESLTNDLTSPASLAREGANAKEILYRQVGVSGLGDYSRNSGYTNNSVTVEWKTATFNYDRGTKITLDTQDNEETMGDTYLIAQNSLQTYQVAPEGDAFTFATIASKTGISVANESGESYANGEEFLAALLKGVTKMDEDQVPAENRILYATPTLLNSVMALDTSKSREVLGKFAKTVAVPQTRFYTKIDLLDGKSSNEEMGGFKKDTTGKDINFMIIHKPAIIKFDKHVVSDAIPPELNADADAYISKYRKYGLVDVFNNKTAGIYISYKAA